MVNSHSSFLRLPYIAIVVLYLVIILSILITTEFYVLCKIFGSLYSFSKNIKK